MPNGYKIVRQSFFDDLQGEKRTCWDIEILQDDEKGYLITFNRPTDNQYSKGPVTSSTQIINNKEL